MNEFFKRALDKYVRHDFKGMLLDLNQALQLNPSYAKAYTLRAVAYIQLEDYQGAVGDCTQALRLDPNVADAYNNRGVAYSQLRDYQRAVTDFTQAVRLDPNDARAYYNGGFAYLQLGNYQAAIANYTQTLRLNPSNAPAYNERGIAHYRLGNYQAAVTDYTKAIQLNPSDTGAYYNRGDVRYQLADYQGAIADYTEAIRLNLDFVAAYNNRGNAYLQLGDYQRAIVDYTYGLQLNPNDEYAYYNRGNAYFHLKDYQRAVADFTQSLDLNPDYTEANSHRGTTYLRQGDYQRAIADFERAIQLNPNDTGAYYQRGVAYAHLGDYQASIRDYSLAIQNNPDHAEAYIARGSVYLQLEDYQAVVRDYTHALRVNPDNNAVYNDRGVAHLKLGDYRRAIADYTQAINLNPDDAEIYFNRGDAHSLLGDYQRGVVDYTQAIRLNPYYAHAYYNRGESHSQMGNYAEASDDFEQAASLFQQQENVDNYLYTLKRIKKLTDEFLSDETGDDEIDGKQNKQQIEGELLSASNQALNGKSKQTLAQSLFKLAATAITPVFQWKSKQTAVEKLLQQASDLYKQRDFDRAIAALTQVIQLNPNNTGAYVSRAVVCEALADYQRAVADYTQAIQLNPDDATVYYYRGTAHIQLGDYQAAVENYTQAIRLDPNYVTAYQNRSIAHFKLGDYQAAVVDCNQLLRLTPNYSPAYVERGAAYTRLGKIQAAIADFNQALQLNPSIAQAFFNRAIAQLELENIQEAIADFQQAAQLYSDQGNLAAQQDALKQISRLKEQSSDEFFNEIEADDTEEIEFYSDDAETLFEMGNSYFQLGNYQEAIAEYTQVIQFCPDSAEAYYNRGVAHAHLKDYQVAVADFTEAIQLTPDNDDAYYNRGIAYSILTNYQAAVVDFTETIQLNSSNTNAYNYRGIARNKLADYQGSVTDFTQAIRLNPDYADAYYNRGDAHSQLGNYPEAIEDFQQASELFLQQGKLDDSQNALERIIALIGLEETKDNEVNEEENQPLKNSPKQYLTGAADIRALIDKLALNKILWLDTETADYNTSNPRVSLIQVLAEPENLTGDRVYILDVLDKPELVTYFVDQIMVNPKIEKVFHNASYDLRFLGKEQAKNVTCTYKLAQKITKAVLQVTDLKLKTLAAQLCKFSNIDKEEQGSDWGRRPLTKKQLEYAKMDPVYLAQVHHRLLEITKNNLETVTPMSLSVTNVKVAFECPRLFYLGHRFDGKTLFLPPGNEVKIGTAFHDLSEQFVAHAKQDKRFQALFEPAFEELQLSAIAPSLQKLFYDVAFFPYLQLTIQNDSSKAPALHKLWQGLTGIIRRWAELLVGNRRYCSAQEVISKTFLAQELSVKHEFTLPDGTQQMVKGRFDSLVYDFEHQRLCVVEYKTYQSADHSAQLAQVAVYSYMLQEKIGVSINSAVYSVLPDLQELTFSWEQLENTVHQLVPKKLQQMRQWLIWEPPQPNPPPPTSQPHLCDICPQRKKCQSFFDLDEVKPEKVDNTDKELVATLKSFGIGVDYQGAAIGPAFIRVKLKPHAGVKVSSILRLSNDLQVQLGLADSPLITPQAGYVSIDLPRFDRQIASFEDYIQPQTTPPDAPVRIAIGVNLEGQLVEADLSDPNTCHFLIGGTTGSGKSEFLRSLLLSLLLRHSPNQLKIALVDPKRVTFSEFEQMPWLYSPVVKDSDRAIELMHELVAEMERRYQLFEVAGCADLSTYNQQASQMLPRIVCIFDEYADFMAEKETRMALEQSIKRLGAMARASGIHLIVATQRPEAKVVTPLIRSNLPGRVALRTASEADSIIVLGGKQSAAAYLLGKGDLLYQVGAQLHRLQSLLASTIQLP